MPKINRYLLFDTVTKKYCDGFGKWMGINSTNRDGFSKEEVDSCMRRGISDRNWVFVKIEQDGKLTIVE